MIHVKGLHKNFASSHVLRGLDFQAPEGQIVGFLGSNGAGKSTTMKILSSFLPPSKGEATVAGLDVLRDSQRLCQQLGYLPENLPIYPEMRVSEYLNYRAQLRGLAPRDRASRIAELAELCDLSTAMRKSMASLSKGYKQRVGLADALLHDPPVLILDEPTSGLDPRQLATVRELILSFRGKKTVLLSSHLLDEIEQICDRVLILAEGVIQVDDDRAEWESRLARRGRLHLQFTELDPGAAKKLKRITGVVKVHQQDRKLVVESTTDVRARVFDLAKNENWTLIDMHWKNAKLEELFLELTDHRHKESE